jgi:5'-nucleotidase / UDP-sugar diphosphatase
VKSITTRLTGLTLALLFVACTSVDGRPKPLTIIHTNDMHAGFVPHEAMWLKSTPRPMVGGFSLLAALIDSVRTASGHAVVLDAGDVMTGNPITERMYDGASGGALFAMMRSMRYDAWCPGNHDLDISQENLKALARVAGFPMVCANLVDDQGKFPLGNIPYTIVTKGDVRVGVIGVISQQLSSLVNQTNLTGLRVLDPVTTVQRYADELQGKVDLVVALTHQGVDDDSLLAASVKGVGVIVGGHSHTRLKHPRVVNGVLIVQTGSNAESLGVLDLEVDGGVVTHYDGNLIPLSPGRTLAPSPVSSLVDSMKTEIEKEYSEQIGTLSGDWMRGDGQTAIGTFIAEAQREAGAADVAFMNNHGIRRDLPAGPITKKLLFEVLPFRNVLVLFQLTGAELRKVVAYDLEKKPAVQIAGIRATWHPAADGTIVLDDVRVGGKPIDDAMSYRCAASDYFVGEAERYLGVAVRTPSFTQQTLFDIVVKAVRTAKTVRPTVLYTFEHKH